MAVKLMAAFKKGKKIGDAVGTAKATKNGNLTKHIAKNKAQKSLFKMFK
ncbi:hypothetical protein ACM26V_00265 [Salipaludibacillus sp. HK11]